MQLLQLELENFGRHDHLSIDFPVGITGIVGPNGSGKSTIAHALQFALTGESGNAGTKTDDLNWRSADGTGTVSLTFVKDEHEGRLKRAIHAARASLKYGSINARSVSAVNDEMLALLGVSRQTVEDIVFVQQGSIEKLLFEKPSERKKNMHALFGIDRTEPIREILRNEVGSLSLSPLDERIKQLTTRIDTEIDPQLRAVNDERKALQLDVSSQNEDRLKELIATYDAAATLKAHVAQMEASLSRLTSQPPIDVDTLKADLETKKSFVETSAEKINKLRQTLASLESAKQIHQARSALLSELASLDQARTKPAPAALGFGSEVVHSGEQQLAEARAEIASKQAFVSAFAGKGDTVCPTCHQSVKNAGELAARMKAEVVERQALIASVDACVRQARKALTEFERELDRHTNAVAQASVRKLAVEATLQSMPAIGMYDAATEQEMRTMLDGFNHKLTEIGQLEKQYNAVAQQKIARDAQIASTAAAIEAARQQLVQQAPAEEYARAKTTLEFIATTREKIAELDGRFKQLQEQRASSIKEQQSLEEQLKKEAALKTYQSLCERARTVLHYDNLPRLAMTRYLGVLNEKLNSLLSIFNVPFTSTIKDDLSVVCNIPDVGEKPAERLSGGQRVMLGISFRIAIYNMFATDLGLMVLDEPTLMLDTDRIECVTDMFESVGRYARNANMQLVVITHEDALKRAFDHTVEL